MAWDLLVLRHTRGLFADVRLDVPVAAPDYRDDVLCKCTT